MFTTRACNFIPTGASHSYAQVRSFQSIIRRRPIMKKMLCRMMMLCLLTAPLVTFAQSGDNMKQDQSQDQMKQDQMKHDDMKKDEKASKKKDNMKKDNMKKDDKMKQDDNMHHDDNMKQN